MGSSRSTRLPDCSQNIRLCRLFSRKMDKQLEDLKNQLSLTQEQMASVELIVLSNRKKIEEIKGSNQKNPRQFQKGMKKIMDKQADEIEKILDSKTPSYHRTIYSDGTVGFTSVKMLVVRNSQGKAVRAYGVNQDITESIKAEEEREKMQFLLSNALELVSLAPWEYRD